MKLDGLRVLDLSRFLPGPYLTMTLADHGAEVIKIEDTKAGDPSRSIGAREAGISVYFRNLNRGKKSLALDLKAPEGRALFLKLAETTDVVIETFRPGVADRLGIGYDAVRRVNSGAVYCSISAFGQRGPYRDRPAHDLSVGALAGTVALSRGADGTPSMPGLPPTDLAAALLGLSAVLIALIGRTRTGQGDYIDLAMYDAALSFLAPIAGQALVEGRAPEPGGDRILGGAALYRVYRVKDGGHITLGGSEPKFLAELLNGLGRPDLIAIGLKPAGPDQAPLHRYLEEIFLTKTRDEWNTWFAGRDICFAPVLDMVEAFADSNIAARAMLVLHEGGGKQLGVAIKYANEPGCAAPHAPALGEHTEVLVAALGYDRATIEALRAKGVIGQSHG
ncbi:MAG: CoA transferase [Alphaproteobacteria bacterium]|nr:CoA transferase [Alphaproteobacteria bacterium]